MKKKKRRRKKKREKKGRYGRQNNEGDKVRRKGEHDKV